MSVAPRPSFSTFGWLGLWTLGMVCFTAGCSDSDKGAETPESRKYQVAEDDGSTPGGSPAIKAGGLPSQPPSLSIDQLEAITIPEGTPEELLKFADELGDKVMALQVDTGGQLQGAAKTRAIELFRAIVGTSEKILAQDDAELSIRRDAIENEAGAMLFLSQLEPDKGWPDKIRQFSIKLASDKNPNISLAGKSIAFGINLGDFAQGRTQDVEGVMNRLRALLQEPERDDGVMSVALQAMNLLLTSGRQIEARQALDLIAAAFQDSDDPALVNESANLREMGMFLDADMDQRFDAMTANREGAADEFMAEMAKILDRPNVGSLTLNKGVRYIGVLQEKAQYELARKLCGMYDEAFAKTTDEQLKQDAKQLTQMALRRLDLIGKPLIVEGRRTDGVSLDFSHYQGKVVLVEFFTVFAAGCQQELIGISSIYQKYHERGFEVIGVSVDQDPEALKQFLDQVKLPWMTVIGAEFAVKCGADMFPFGVLLDRTGKVVDIFVQGPAITGKLDALLGTPDTTKPPVTGPGNPSGEQSSHPPLRQMRQDAGLVATGALEMDSPFLVSANPLDETAPPQRQESEPADEEDLLELDEAEEAVNPYLARDGLTPSKLVNFLFDMQEKTKSIRRRPGFAQAVVDAADRIMQSDAKAKFQLIAAETKLDILHEFACIGDEKSDQQLVAFVRELAEDTRPAIALRVKFYQLERQALEVDELDIQQVPTLLADLQTYFAGQGELENRHLRMASATVHAVNRLEQDTQRDEYFTQFGNLFAESEDRQLARYGKKLAKGGKGRASDLVGKPLELDGVTDLGVPLDWSSYRGKVVLVDFWATWCGPCLREMPHVRTLYDELSDSGLDVVAVSLDEDLEALAKYLDEKKVPWTNVIGRGARELAAKYEVRGIPTMMLVDGQGKVVAVANKVDALRPEIEKLLGRSRPSKK